MTVDVQLLAVLGLPLAYLFGFLQLALWLAHRERRIHLFWGVANLVSAVGATLLVARTVLPLWITSSLANAILLAGGLVLWSSMCRFAGREPPWRTFVTAVVLFFILFQALWTLTSDLGARVLLASLATAAVNAGVAFELLRAQQDQPLRMRALLSALFALHALFYLFRAATAVTLDSSMDLLQATGIQNLTILLASIKVVLWNLGAILMARELRQRLSPPQ